MLDGDTHILYDCHSGIVNSLGRSGLTALVDPSTPEITSTSCEL